LPKTEQQIRSQLIINSKLHTMLEDRIQMERQKNQKLEERLEELKKQRNTKYAPCHTSPCPLCRPNACISL
jgi:hypothetical protein